MKKILIFYASYGGGHLSAAKSVQECLSTYHPEIETKLIDCMKYVNIALEKVTTAAYKEMAKKFPWAWGRVYASSQKGPLAHISSYSNRVMAVKLLKLLRVEKPDMVISTHPFGSQMCSYLKRKGKINCKIATIMTDFAPHDQWLVGSDYVEAIFVSQDKMKEQIVAEGIPSQKIFPTGIPFSSRFLQTYDKEAIIKKYGLKMHKPILLFFGGGEFGLGKSRTLEIFRLFVENFSEWQIIAISGKNEKMNHSFHEIVTNAKREEEIKIFTYSNEIPEIMSICDFVVTKPGGLTVTESLVSHLPLIIINPIPGQEEENAAFLEEHKVGIWLKKHDDLKARLINLFSSPKEIAQMKENVEKLRKPNATKDICDISLSLLDKK